MSIVRKTAEHLANFTERHASPGAKPWAEAIANELDAIPNDWRALAWSLGSTRILFRHRPKPIHDLAELNEAAEKYADRRRHAMNNGWLPKILGLGTVAVLAITYLPAFHHHRVSRADGLFIASILWTALLNLLQSREPNVPDRDDQPGMILFYKQDLAQANRLLLFQIPSSILLLAYCLMCSKDLGPATAIVVALWLVPASSLISRYLNNRSRIAQIEAFLEAPGNS